MPRTFAFLAGSICLLALILGSANLVAHHAFDDLPQDIEPQAKSPAAALKSIRVAPGFTVEQVATEPLVKDPIAFEWGADGKLWVVEMGDYPLGIDGKGKPGGVVRYLEDANGDGRYDRSTTFLEGLGFPNGVMPWRKGVLVSCARHLLRRGSRWRRQGRPSRGALHRLRRGQPAAPAQRFRTRTRRLGLRRQWRQRRQGPLEENGEGHADQRQGLPFPARYGRIRSRERSDPVWSASRRLGPMVRQQ